MKNLKYLFALLLLSFNTTLFAQDIAINNRVDATATREAIGLSGYTVIPLLVLIIFLVVLAFGTQKVPGLKS